MAYAVDAARWLGNANQANQWQREYDDFYATFRRAAERDTRIDAHGNRFAPIRMVDKNKPAPQTDHEERWWPDSRSRRWQESERTPAT